MTEDVDLAQHYYFEFVAKPVSDPVNLEHAF